MKQSLRQPNYVESMRLTAVADFPRRKTEVFEEFPFRGRAVGGIGKSGVGGWLNGRLIQLLHRQWEHPRQSGTRESNTKPDPSLGNDSTELNSTRLDSLSVAHKKSQKLKVQFCRYYFTFTTKGRQKIKKKATKK